MTELTIQDFPAFFEAVRSFESGQGFLGERYPPFKWQKRLAESVAQDGWPEVLDLPTASGKTASLEIAVFTLALEANSLPENRKAPRRIFFVVDRRVVVDQAYERAGKIADALASSLSGDGAHPAVRAVAKRLQILGGIGASPLGHEKLRGGVHRKNTWAGSPAQPAIVSSTVDQLGSRLLFRSYDASPRTAPIDAGLAGNDTLILLDEAHCARPFNETMGALSRYRGWGDPPLESPFQFVTLSATPDVDERVSEKPQKIFRLVDEERHDDELRERLEASKPAALIVARKARVPRGGGREDVIKAREELATQLARHALAFLDSGQRRRIAVMVNRVATALEVRNRIRDALGGGSSNSDSDSRSGMSRSTSADKAERCNLILMTGRMRPLDRDGLIARWQPRLRAGTDSNAQDRPVIIVSTQSLEVGADFDFDALVTEAASLDAMRQRFGRLNRLGKLKTAAAVAVIARYQEKNSDDDPVYGGSLATTWQWLTNEAADRNAAMDLWPGLKEREIAAVVDFGIESLEQKLKETDLRQLHAPVTHAPVMLPAHVDRWVQTSPVARPDPDPAVFLHGGTEINPQVNLLWRIDLDQKANERDLIQALSFCPPSAVESLPVSLGWAKSWLRGDDEVPAGESDVEGTGSTGRERNEQATTKRKVVLWRGRDRSVVTSDPADLRPGDFVVIPENDPGSFEDLLRWSQERAPVVDLGDQTQLQVRGRPVLRLVPELIDEWREAVASKKPLEDLKEFIQGPLETIDAEGVRLHLELLVDQLRDGEVLNADYAWLSDTISALLAGRFEINQHPGARSRGIILRGSRRSQEPQETEVQFYVDELLDEDDADRRSESAGSVALETHLSGVEETVVRFSERCGLPEPVTADLALAARLHDIGKVDERFQALLRGDGLPRSVKPDEVLARSHRFPTSRQAYRRLARRSGLPVGFRHELVSVRLVESDPDLLSEANDRELVLHLIASHHGRCRPFAPVIPDNDPVEVRWESDGRKLRAESETGLEELDSGVSDRFWQLVRRYGWWGLAYLEAILRKADHLRSAAEEQLGGVEPKNSAWTEGVR